MRPASLPRGTKWEFAPALHEILDTEFEADRLLLFIFDLRCGNDERLQQGVHLAAHRLDEILGWQ